MCNLWYCLKHEEIKINCKMNNLNLTKKIINSKNKEIKKPMLNLIKMLIISKIKKKIKNLFYNPNIQEVLISD